MSLGGHQTISPVIVTSEQSGNHEPNRTQATLITQRVKNVFGAFDEPASEPNSTNPKFVWNLKEVERDVRLDFSKDSVVLTLSLASKGTEDTPPPAAPMVQEKGGTGKKELTAKQIRIIQDFSIQGVTIGMELADFKQKFPEAEMLERVKTPSGLWSEIYALPSKNEANKFNPDGGNVRFLDKKATQINAGFVTDTIPMKFGSYAAFTNEWLKTFVSFDEEEIVKKMDGTTIKPFAIKGSGRRARLQANIALNYLTLELEE